MDFAGVKALLRRQWRVTLAGIIFLVAGFGYVVTQVPLTYKTTGALVLVPPRVTVQQANQANNPALANPVLSFSSSLNVVASVTIRALSDRASAEALKQSGATAPYTFGTGVDTTPLITVTAKSKHASEAIHTATVVLQAAQTELAHQQAIVQAPPSTYVTAFVVTHPDTARGSWTGRLKELAVVIGFGVVATLLVAFGFDRRGRRVQPVAETSTPFEAPSGGLSLVDKVSPRPLQTTFHRQAVSDSQAADSPLTRP
jgi:hypothetical protein